MAERYDRMYPGKRKSRDVRSAARRDRDRVLYSSEFRRLAGITQVIPANDLFPIHNRLTHSLEVAQIGRSISERLLRRPENEPLIKALGGLDPDVVEAASLAHDVGHPPFGHVAEEVLNRLVRECGDLDGFEGNAQTFRILTRLAVRDDEIEGLNLTRATLRAVLKYPWLKAETGQGARKWGAYSTETDAFFWACKLPPPAPGPRSLEANLMDWSDDVAYAVHDVEDFYRAGLVPLQRLARDPDERRRIVEQEIERNDKLAPADFESLAAALDGVVGFIPIEGPYEGRRQDRAFLRNFTSALVDRYVRAVTLGQGRDGQPQLQINPAAQREVVILKGLTWQYVIESRTLMTQRYGHKRLIAALFAMFCEAAASPVDRRIIPEFYQEQLDGNTDDRLIARTVADFIASMTESQVVALHNRLTGVSLGAPLDPIVP